jgi:hypothetical protein
LLWVRCGALRSNSQGFDKAIDHRFCARAACNELWRILYSTSSTRHFRYSVSGKFNTTG